MGWNTRKYQLEQSRIILRAHGNGHQLPIAIFFVTMLPAMLCILVKTAQPF